MAPTREVFYVKLAVEGIQNYITSTGKLMEMIGGSEIINYMASPDFYHELLKGQGLREDTECLGLEDHYIVAQANAGTLCLIMPSKASASNFLEQASLLLLGYFPGLPLYGSVTGFDWSDDGQGRDAYREARRIADREIDEQRATAPVPCGAPLLPIFRPARLDGLPAVQGVKTASGSEEFISLPSRARRSPAMIERSRQRLRSEVRGPDGLELLWQDNLEELLADRGGKVALICMDGNDLGKLFGKRLQDSSGLSLSESIRSMKALSSLVQDCNNGAFAHACEKIAALLAPREAKDGKLLMPLRPLVMGGDDITVITRADVALPFVSLFSRRFEELGREQNLSVGIGMVVMNASYPFAKAFPLAESLQDSAKRLTSQLEPGLRPSSIDYLVLTEDVENNIEELRQRLFTMPGQLLLTTKPFRLSGGEFTRFLRKGQKLLLSVAHSQLRNAWTDCRRGEKEAQRHWTNLRENIARGIGGRKGAKISPREFESIFSASFFEPMPDNSARLWTALGDYLELQRLLPENDQETEELLQLLEDAANA